MNPDLLEWFAAGDPPNGLDTFRTDVRALWTTYAAALVPAWARAHPGTRPWAWWRYSAPEPARLRLGGTGTPQHEALPAIIPTYALGIPTLWTGAALLETCRTRMGIPLFGAVAIDPDDPPAFEAQAAYLQRHGLLSPAERARADFAPELLPREFWPDA